MSESNVNEITGADVATTTGIIGATVGIGQYIINDYVITIAPIEGDYGYTMTITRGSEAQTVTLYGLSTEQYNAMLGYLEQAQAASTAAQSAADAAARSEHYAGNHATRAIGASQAATASASTAEFAATRAETAATSAGNAQTAAETAASNAATAQAAAASAAINADNSQIAAEAAATRAEDAERNAAAGATNAQTYAGQAQQNATNAGQSAASAAQTLTQVQAEGASQIAAIDAEGQRVIDSIPEDYTEVVSDVADLKSQMSTKASTDMALGAYPTDALSGAIVAFDDGADGVPVKGLIVDIDPVQGGWTGVIITRCGKNVFNNAVADWKNGYFIDASGNEGIEQHYRYSQAYIPVKPNTTYSLSVQKTSTSRAGITVPFYSADKTFISRTTVSAASTEAILQTGTLVTPSNAHYMRISCALDSADIQLEVNSSATAYEPYTSDTYTIAFPPDVGAVNDGTVDVINGVLTTGGQDYEVTSVKVLTLLGGNTIYADTGDTTVNYRADPTLYIQRINTPTDDDMTADAQIASGKYFVIGNTLYKATTTIPAGDTINPGTNCVITNLAEALNALNA